MIQIVATVTSTFTIFAALITFVLFFRMQKRLRHEFVMFSIFGCFIRGLWYFLFSLVVLFGRTVTSTSSFCQATGFFTQLGNEMSDIATLLIAIHGALQIFRPPVSTLDVGDGLHDYRHHCFTVLTILPIILASLPFVNKGPAYTQQGAFCALPTSPIVYRLALSWVPRFMIGLCIISLSIAVYLYVQVNFQSFSASQQSLATPITVPNRHPHLFPGFGMQPQKKPTAPSIDSRFLEERNSLPILKTPDYQRFSMISKTSSQPQSPKAQRLDTNDKRLHFELEKDYFQSSWTSGRKVSVATSDSKGTDISAPTQAHISLPDISILKGAKTDATQKLSIPSSSGLLIFTSQQEQGAGRRRLMKQLRSIFVYPIVYLFMWTPPSIFMLMQLTPRFMKHLPAHLGIFSTVCLTLMGCVDCVVFIWREKPWRLCESTTVAPDQDGRQNVENRLYDNNTHSALDPVTHHQHSSTRSSRARSTILALCSKRLAQLPTASPSAANTIAKQRAYERLAFESKDRREAVKRSLESTMNIPLARLHGQTTALTEPSLTSSSTTEETGFD